MISTRPDPDFSSVVNVSPTIGNEVVSVLRLQIGDTQMLEAGDARWPTLFHLLCDCDCFPAEKLTASSTTGYPDRREGEAKVYAISHACSVRFFITSQAFSPASRVAGHCNSRPYRKVRA